MDDFFTPENHKDFKALKLASDIDANIRDCAIAFIEPGGGGPYPDHTHSHNHLFTVISGIIEINEGNEKKQVSEGMSIIVNGELPHSVWNIGTVRAKVMGISLNKDS